MKILGKPPRVYLKGLFSGLRCRVTSSKLRPFLATKSASFSITLRTSGSEGGAGPAAAGCRTHGPG